MAIASVNGTTFGVSASLPTTYDSNVTTGYPSLTFTAVGEVVDVGDLAKAYSVIPHQGIGVDYPTKLKGTYDVGNITITLARVTADAGQVILDAALAATASYAFQITLPSGGVGNFTGKVLKKGISAIKTNGVEMTSVEIAIDPHTVYEA